MKTTRDILLDYSRTEAEEIFESRSKVQYLGDNNLICRILGREKFFAFANDVGFSLNVALDGFWEFWLTKFFAKCINPGDTVLDIGANLGYYTLLAANLVGQNGMVVAYEPNPSVFRHLVNSVSINGYSSRVRALNAAISFGHETETLPFFVPGNEPKNGRFIEDGEDADSLRTCGELFDVNLGSIDPADFARVDFIKIDVEGAEIAVLKHLRPLIERFRPQLIVEVNFGRNYTYEDVQAALGVTEPLKHLDFDSNITTLTPEMALNERIGDDWLVYIR